MQLRLDAFLKILLRHPTFATHEMVWEFFLVPDIDPSMLAERSARKAELRVERLREEYEPIYDVREVELFVQHARENVRSLHHAAKSVLRRTNKLRFAASDLNDAAKMANTAIHSLTFLPTKHLNAVERYTKTLSNSDANPISGFYYSMHAISSTVNAILTSLSRPSSLITSMSTTQKAIDRHNLSVRRSDRWPLGLLDEARSRVQRDAQEKMDKCKDELEILGRELRYTQQIVAGELASWQENRVEIGRKALKELASSMVVVERARLESMKRAIRDLGIGKSKSIVNGVNDMLSGSRVPVNMDVSQAEVNRGRIEDVTDEMEGNNDTQADHSDGQLVDGETITAIPPLTEEELMELQSSDEPSDETLVLRPEQ